MSAAMETSDLSTMLQDQADRLFSQHVQRSTLAQADKGDWPSALWDEVAKAGLPLALVAEEQGGIGLSASDAMSLVRLAAHHCLPLPLAETMLALAAWTAAGGALPDGPASFTDASFSLSQVAAGAVLHGSASWVPWGGDVAHILIQATDPMGARFLVLLPREGLTAKAVYNLAGEPRASFDLEGVQVSSEMMRPASATDLRLHGAFLRSQQMVGAMQRCLTDSVDYANNRSQFGRPISKFQAVQHMLAVAAVELGASTAAADQAAEAFGTEQYGFTVAVAKARCGEAAGKVAGVAHQVHAAMGFTQEMPLHFATRRLWSWREEFGAEPYWQDVIGRQVASIGGEALWALLVGS